MMNARMRIVAAVVALGFTMPAAGCSRHKQEAIILANKGDVEVKTNPGEAIKKYEQATTLDPTNHRILYKLAKAYKKKEQWDKVAVTLAKATDLAPSYANYWLERAWALEKRAEKKEISYDEAEEMYKKCIEADPNRDECYERLAIAHLWTDEEQQALAALTKAIEHRPTMIRYYTRLASWYLMLSYDKEAEQVLKAAKEMADPGKDKKDLYNVHTLMAEVHRDRGEIDKMVTELEAAKSVDTSDAGLLFNLGMAYSKLSPPKKAESIQRLKGFVARACRSAKSKKYKAECDQANATIQKLKGPGS